MWRYLIVLLDKKHSKNENPTGIYIFVVLLLTLTTALCSQQQEGVCTVLSYRIDHTDAYTPILTVNAYFSNITLVNHDAYRQEGNRKYDKLDDALDYVQSFGTNQNHTCWLSANETVYMLKTPPPAPPPAPPPDYGGNMPGWAVLLIIFAIITSPLWLPIVLLLGFIVVCVITIVILLTPFVIYAIVAVIAVLIVILLTVLAFWIAVAVYCLEILLFTVVLDASLIVILGVVGAWVLVTLAVAYVLLMPILTAAVVVGGLTTAVVLIIIGTGSLLKKLTEKYDVWGLTTSEYSGRGTTEVSDSEP